jgi:nitrile hydratase subunit beta
MNGVHDMGGMHGFGKVEPEADEPVFHAPWEGRVLAMNRATGWLGLWTIDGSRFSLEMLPPEVYLRSSYYRRWALGLENRCVQLGLISADELAAGRALHPAKPLAPAEFSGKPVKPALAPADVPSTLSRGNYERPALTSAKFAPGDSVRTRNINPPGHTRLPRYARGRSGVIESIRGCHVFPDVSTTSPSDEAHWLYTVVFDSRELWGDGADPTLKVSIDAWEPYLDGA